MKTKTTGYMEGRKAQRHFENAMATLFRVSRADVTKKIKKNPKKGKD